MNIQYHFSSSSLRPFKNNLWKPSPWNPPLPKNKTLNEFQQSFAQNLIKLSGVPPPPWDNLNTREREALMRLQDNKEITIKPADKGGGWVILNTQDYINKVLLLLENKKFYKKLDHNPTLSNANEITCFIDYLLQRGRISQSTADFLYPTLPPRTPAFYGLPKIHKEGVPLRPIVSGNDSPTENISSYMDFVLQPMVRSLPSYLRDTKDFLTQIFSLPPLPGNCYLVTADVVSLYTNIPHEEGIEAVLNKISENRGSLPEDTPPNATIRILLEYILKYNIFEFIGTIYQQVCGSAMGTKCAPPYACIFMSYIEEKIQKLSNSILFWKRFIDDIFFIFNGTQTELLTLFDKMNSLHDTIKFTFEYSTTEVHFLDTKVQIDKVGNLFTDLYTKPTDTFSLLHFESFHPLSTKKSIIYSQALRYRMIITRDTDLHRALSHLEWVLKCRNYPAKMIQEQFSKALSLTQKDILSKPPEKEESSRDLVFSIPYSTNHSDITRMLKQQWREIERDPELTRIWEKPPTVATMRHQNLKDVLVHSRQPNPDP